MCNLTRPIWCQAIIAVCLLALAGCGGGGSSSSNASQGASVTVAIANSPPSTIGVGANWHYAATVTGSSNTAVTWSESGGGTIDSSTGLYIAPNTVPSPATVTITATSQADTSQVATTTVTVQATDPLGTVSAVSALPSCLGSVAGGACYQMTVSCPGAADLTTYLKVNNPSGAPAGTVLFGVGTGGSGLYDDPTGGGYDFGGSVVQSILNAGYNTVQVTFGAPFDNGTQPNGWLQGPGGVRRLACRYATVANWVYNNPTTINSGVSATNSAPMCATGNSGGSAVIAYAVYEYGLASEFAMIEPTSGPVMTRIDLGCSPASSSGTGPICTGSENDSSMTYESADAAVIDESYQASGSTSPTLCSSSISGNPGPDAATLFLSDSILYAPANVPISLPNTIVKLLYGDDDPSNAVPQGLTWEGSITPSSASPNPLYECISGAPHDIPSYQPGATQIANDIVGGCH